MTAYLTTALRMGAKKLFWRIRQPPGSPRLGLILGCQRSGTNMLNDAFGRDWSCVAFGEDGGLALGAGTASHRRWRWRPLPDVAETLRAYRVPLLIAKPIVESQRALELLDCFPHARVIWMYRHYLGVAQSSRAKFGLDASVENLAAAIDPARRDHWYSENLSDRTRELVRSHYDPARPVADLKAIGWLVRNSLYFQQGLQTRDRVTICRYEDVVADPQAEMRRLYEFVGAPFPGPQICRGMHADSVRKGHELEIAPEIRALCDEMLERLNAAKASRTIQA
jgi:hypothetical protein